MIRVYTHLTVPRWPDLSHSNGNLSNFHSPSRLIHGIPFSKPALLLSLSTCVLHVFLGRRRLFFPFTSNANSFLKTCPSSLLNTCPYHLTPFGLCHLNHRLLQSQHLHYVLSPLSPSVLHHTLLSPLLSQSFSKLICHFIFPQTNKE